MLLPSLVFPIFAIHMAKRAHTAQQTEKPFLFVLLFISCSTLGDKGIIAMKMFNEADYLCVESSARSAAAVIANSIPANFTTRVNSM
jgi:hypothetical protein